MTVLSLSLKLLVFIAVGFVCRKLRVLGDGFDKLLNRFLMAVPLPCMIISSFRLEYSADRLLSAPIIIALSFGSLLVLGLVVWLCTAKLADPAIRKTVRFCLMFTNFTFVGFAVVKELYGAEGFFNYVLFTLPVRIVYYGSASIILGKPGEKVNVKETVKRFLCEPVIAVFIGLLLYVTQLPLPAFLSGAIETIGNMASPLGLILCGTIIADADILSALRKPSVWLVTALRLLIVPALMLGLYVLIGVNREILRSVVYYFAMPVASLVPSFLLRYDPEAVEARTASGYMVVASTLFCVLTIPLWSLALNVLFP